MLFCPSLQLRGNRAIHELIVLNGGIEKQANGIKPIGFIMREYPNITLGGANQNWPTKCSAQGKTFKITGPHSRQLEFINVGRKITRPVVIIVLCASTHPIPHYTILFRVALIECATKGSQRTRTGFLGRIQNFQGIGNCMKQTIATAFIFHNPGSYGKPRCSIGRGWGIPSGPLTLILFLHFFVTFIRQGRVKRTFGNKRREFLGMKIAKSGVGFGRRVANIRKWKPKLTFQRLRTMFFFSAFGFFGNQKFNRLTVFRFKVRL